MPTLFGSQPLHETCSHISQTGMKELICRVIRKPTSLIR